MKHLFLWNPGLSCSCLEKLPAPDGGFWGPVKGRLGMDLKAPCIFCPDMFIVLSSSVVLDFMAGCVGDGIIFENSR